MGLGPKYEGSFIPPAKPLRTPDSSLEEYSKEMERYIEQLHDQLQFTFEKTQQVINQVIYGGDGDGEFTPGALTEEGGTDIVSTQPSHVSGQDLTGGDSVFYGFPEAGGMGFVRPTPSGFNNSASDEMPVWRCYVPYSFTPTKCRYMWRDAAAVDLSTVFTYGFYNTNKVLLYQHSEDYAGVGGGGATNVKEDTLNWGVLPAGMHWFAYAIYRPTGGSGDVQAVQFQINETLVMKVQYSWGEDTVGAASGVLPATLTGPGASNRPYPPLMNFMGA